MIFYKTVIFLLTICIFCVSEKLAEENDSDGAALEQLIRHELDKFAAFQEELNKAKANLNVTLVLSHTVLENDNLKQRNEVAFHPIATKLDPEGLRVHETIDKALLKEVFAFAEQIEATAIVSQEKYLADGVLYSEDVYAENVNIHYEDGDSDVVLECKDDELSKEENAFEDFLNILRQHELPVKVTKELYNDKGELIKTDNLIYKPRRVKIVESDMSTEMQLNVAEALKRVSVMKDTDKERLALLCRYLGIEHYDYKWQAIIGEGNHYFTYFRKAILELDGETYTVYGV